MKIIAMCFALAFLSFSGCTKKGGLVDSSGSEPLDPAGRGRNGPCALPPVTDQTTYSITACKGAERTFLKSELLFAYELQKRGRFDPSPDGIRKVFATCWLMANGSFKQSAPDLAAVVKQYMIQHNILK